MKISPYCTPAMLSALTECARGGEPPEPLRWPLISRGWIDRQLKLTPAGAKYLASKNLIW